MVGTTPPLASHFARRELRPEVVHGMEDPAQDAAAAATTAAAAATPTTSTTSPGTKARPARASKQRRAHGGEEATEKMLSRLTSKLQEKRKTFAFSFAVDGSGGEQSSNDSRPLDELVRELEVGDSAKSELERKKKEKKKAKKLAKKGAAKPQANDQDASVGGCVVVEDDDKAAGADSQASSVPATDTPALPLSADTNQGQIDKVDQAQASRKPLGPPPGLELPDKGEDENKPPKVKKKRSRKKKNATTKEEEKDVVVLHWDSWKEAATEEEKLRKRFGQGTRNVSAIARRGEKKGVGVIGLAGAAVAKEGGRVSEDGADFGTPLTNAFSFGFAL